MGYPGGMNNQYNLLGHQIRMDQNDYQYQPHRPYNRMADFGQKPIKVERGMLPVADNTNLSRKFEYNSDNSEEENKGMGFRMDDRFFPPYSNIMMKDMAPIKQNFLPDTNAINNRIMRPPFFDHQRDMNKHGKPE